ncbi:anthranilate phosphoribosyltransferase [Rhodohalobacter sp. 614A]|uniref:anthranilate phosphoribosyltransferase n=1 Tax=Rhodohalobacter sp. 614A TaxID=2908649 RepID=UPI001F3B0979
MNKSFTEILEKISMHDHLTDHEASLAMKLILHGDISDEEIAAFLLGMRMKGETVVELTSFVQEMRSVAVPVEVDTKHAVDLCGTGGDKSGTFNISTTAMFIVAGAGVPVLKHGNRSVSSKSGSYDVLELLGAVPNLQKKQVEELFNKTGMAFMFAPNFHPAMKYVMPARRALKMRTFFNILGPLVNPANVKCQVIGAFNKETAKKMIQILGNLHTENAYTVNAHDGLDEVSTTSQSEIFELKTHLSGDSVTFDPISLGYEKTDHNSLLGGDAKQNAQILMNVLEGKSTKAQRDIAELNALFAIRASNITDDLEEAKEMAVRSIDSGEAGKKLDQFIKESQAIAAG